jgi:UDP-N-acetylglucosamine acyltransferase
MKPESSDLSKFALGHEKGEDSPDGSPRDRRGALPETAGELMVFAKRTARKARAGSLEQHPHGQDVHPTAIVHPTAKLGHNVSVGAYTVIGEDTVIGDGTEVMNHVTIKGPTTIGKDNRIYPFACIGEDPQDKKYEFQGASALEIGDGNVIREFVTIHRGTPHGHGVTRVGSNDWILAYCHIAHDCIVGDRTIFANCVTLGGHVTVGSMAYLGGFTAVHPNCSIGEVAITGGQTMIAQDVPPFVVASGNRVRLYGVNKIGMERHNFSKQEFLEMQKAYKIFFRSKLPAEEALQRLETEYGDSRPVRNFVTFVRNSKRGICR